MPEVLRYRGWVVRIYREIGMKHHAPHCHVDLGDGNVVVLALPTLSLLAGRGRIPKDLLEHLEGNLDRLGERWEELNDG